MYLANICTIFLLVTGSAFASGSSFVNPDTIKKQLAAKSAVLIDVREQSEVAGGIIGGATWVPMSKVKSDADLAKSFKSIAKDKAIFIYCAVGGRAGIMTQRLKGLGYKNVQNAGGYADLKAAGLLTSKVPAAK